MTDDDIGQLMRALEELTGYLETATHGLTDARLHARPRADSWSANEILAHLRACADVWGGSIVAMIEHDHPTLRYVSPRTWIRRTRYTELPFEASLQAFVAQRAALVQALASLAVDDWSRGAPFTGTTRGREQTILSYVRRIVDHEREHREQIEAALTPP